MDPSAASSTASELPRHTLFPRAPPDTFPASSPPPSSSSSPSFSPSVSPSFSPSSPSSSPSSSSLSASVSCSSSASSFTVLNRQRSSRAAFSAYEACSYFLPFAAVSASCAPHQRYEAVSSALSPSSLSAAAQAAFSAAPCCACPRAVAGDCRRLRSWERLGRVDSLQLPGLYEKLVALLERKVRVRSDFQEAERESEEDLGAEESAKTRPENEATEKRDASERSADRHEARDEGGAFCEEIGRGGEGKNGDTDDPGSSAEEKREDDGRMQKEQKSRQYREATVCELLLGSAVYNAIEMDVHRTFPSLPFFKEEGQTAMRRVLQAYAAFDPEVGYVQGMNFVAGTLLHHSNTCIHWSAGDARGVMGLLLASPADEAPSRVLRSPASAPRGGDIGATPHATGEGGGRGADATRDQDGLHFCIRTREGRVFWLLVAMFYLYDMRRMFLPSLPGVFEKCDRIERMMRIVLPDLAEHLNSAGVSLSLLTSDWLLTLFSYSVPLDVCTAVWTKFFEEGWVFVYKLVIARFKKVKRQMCNQTDLVELVKTAKYSAPQNALAAVGESVVSWLLANPRRSSGRAGAGDAPAASYLTSLGLLLQQQLQQTPSQDALTSGLAVSNDPNASGSKEMWRDIIEDASELDVDRRLFLQVELEMLERERAQTGEKAAAAETPQTRRVASQNGPRLAQAEARNLASRSGDAKLGSLPSEGGSDVSPRRKTVGLWKPTVGAAKEAELREKVRNLGRTTGQAAGAEEAEQQRGGSENATRQAKLSKDKTGGEEQRSFLVDGSPELPKGGAESSCENPGAVSTAPSTGGPSQGAASRDECGDSSRCRGTGGGEKKSSDAGGKDGGRLACSPLLHVAKCLALLRKAGEEDLRTETEELCAECFAHQQLLFHVAEQRQHLQQLAIEALKKPKQVPEALRHWSAHGANIYDE
ncbi:putative TBC domain-containing protein [Neospora caninum Liverpool]|uniref:Putative TBC domain-containing protein n=1 Tax=Neospora caninum (strain Liverpool) TaxID=572307 RepID=F0VBZ7_NEOCL|nr:putative TBC domain-containing protein [Neospora caninum Liverpool]CBZ51131.1 putative TBC domain-containing protein [Neospora caninum Liverpool]CEL68439.1 TPA: TBC domain-containing protein, putative [Neospora caninum Liverpool]|eukprot:XP_003881164.1 putative TBC domain-containing protein [Neospora caninum Liverpool]